MGILLRESIQDVKTIVESTDNGKPKQYWIKGIFMQAEIQNRNGRVYPVEILDRETNRYNEQYISKNKAYGELCHTEVPQIDMTRVSHIITSLKREGNDFYGEAKIINEGYGKIVRGIIDEGGVLAVSSRGVGSLTEKHGKQYVGEDYFLCTPADIVHDPSAMDAVVTAIVENKQWIWESGVWKEQTLSETKNTVVNSKQKQLEETILKSFEKLLKSF